LGYFGWLQGLTNPISSEVRPGLLCSNYDGTNNVPLKMDRVSLQVASSPSDTGLPTSGKDRASTQSGIKGFIIKFSISLNEYEFFFYK